MNAEQLDPEQIRTNAFIGDQDSISGIKLRPFTMQSLIMCRATGNRLVMGIDPENSENIEHDVIGFLYIHCAPIGDVRKACRNKDLFWEKSLEFADTLNVSDFKSIVDKVTAIIQDASSSIVETIGADGKTSGN